MSVARTPLICAALTVVLSACEQNSQKLPFEPDPAHVWEKSIGPEGGLISHPMGMSIEFPPGALTRATQISISFRENLGDFPGAPEGQLVPGTFFDVFPSELGLAKEVEVDIAVAASDLDEDDRIRLGFATQTLDQSVKTEGVTFDLTSGILHGTLPKLGAIAVIVSDNVLNVAPETPPTLGGGTFTDPTGGTPAPSGAAARIASAAGAFEVRCSHRGNVRRCFDSGTMELFASPKIQDRLSGAMVILNPDVSGSLEFTDFCPAVT
jgi:hypothetical protein